MKIFHPAMNDTKSRFIWIAISDTNLLKPARHQTSILWLIKHRFER